MKIIRPSEVIFADDAGEKAFDALEKGNELRKYLERAIKDIQQNAFCGIQLPKRLFPQETDTDRNLLSERYAV